MPRTSGTETNAVTTSETGDRTLRSSPLSVVQVVRMDSESLLMGTETPRAVLHGDGAHRVVERSILALLTTGGHPVAGRSHSRSLDRCRQQLAIASATAIRPEAGASIAASGIRSPLAIASPENPTKSASVTATSATGTCQGPTIWSRWVRPPTVRSAIVTRNRLLPTVGWRRTS